MEEMDENMMRNGLLAELIDQMHGRLADKLYPMPDDDKASQPAAAYPEPGASDTAEEACETAEEGVKDHGDTKGDSHGIPAEGEMTEEELDEMMKGM
jgi:hypothetical protein